ncbi:MAG TPA: exopolysaccharide biosynthesis polyprenyl glycosylphosphotransferase [Opitutaceae bacterium]|nr:exopolysaccharide biosynthesis polyprenyl glycosylphosphotransferase [Opitutaceae bacterium]
MTSARKLTLLMLGLDLIVVMAVFNIVSSLWLRHALPISGEFIVGPLFVPLLLVMLALYLIDGYRPRTDMMSLDYTSLHAIAMMSAMLATLLLTFVFKGPGDSLQSSRAVIAISFFLIGPITLSYRRSVYARFHSQLGLRNLLFLGDRASCVAFREECRRMGTTQPVVFSVVSEHSAAPFAHDEEPVLTFGEVIEQVQRGELAVEAIILRESSRELQPAVAQRLVMLYFAGVPTFTLELFHQVYWRKIPLYRLNQTWLFQEGFQIAREPVFERLKRVCDVVLSLLGLLLASPIICAAGVAIWLEDRGPVFFRQSRIGRNHVAFPLLKLRSMRVTPQPGALYTQPGDARITRVGRFLRATRIDEFPQLWNVLRGQMSLIGPRAEWDRLVEEYERQIPCYYFRHLVKPGITGWAQVNYPYGASVEDTLRKLEYDLYYIRHFSFTLDASIVLKTIHIMLFGKGR